MIFAALIRIQGKLKPIGRSKVVKSKSYEFRYAPLDSIMEHVTPLMQSESLAVIQSVDQDTLCTRVIHASGQWVESETYLNRDHANMQGFGGEVTYKRRYALCALLGVVSDDDTDGPRHKPTGDSFANLSSRRQNFIADLAEVIKDKFADENQWGAYEEYVSVTDQEERVALWSLLPSDVRSGIKKLGEEERKGKQ